MKDRTPTKPGRVLITPEGGGTPYYAVMTMADEPTEEGTPPTKVNLLSDTTATDIHTLTGTAPTTPNTAFSALTAMLSTVYSGRVQIATGSYVGTGTYGSSNPCSLTFNFVPRYFCIYAYSMSPDTSLNQLIYAYSY